MFPDNSRHDDATVQVPTTLPPQGEPLLQSGTPPNPPLPPADPPLPPDPPMPPVTPPVPALWPPEPGGGSLESAAQPATTAAAVPASATAPRSPRCPVRIDDLPKLGLVWRWLMSLLSVR